MPLFHAQIGLIELVLDWTFRLLWGAGGVTINHLGLKLFARVDVLAGHHAVGVGGERTTGKEGSMAMTGMVKFFNGERGYGFIKPDDGGRDVYVHVTAVEHPG